MVESAYRGQLIPVPFPNRNTLKVSQLFPIAPELGKKNISAKIPLECETYQPLAVTTSLLSLSNIRVTCPWLLFVPEKYNLGYGFVTAHEQTETRGLLDSG